jgi:CDP-glucose 4,6-dehydratase
MDERRRQVESVVINPGFWSCRRVFLTGHTGFKGGWLTLILHSLNAKVFGFALRPDVEQGIFTAARAVDGMHHQIGDIRHFTELRASISAARPEIVIHMAAQALVRASYADPLATYATNVMGTAHVLEAARQTPSVKAILVITSDKCYENVGWERGYREIDRLGGRDPYSNSKACAELVANAYRLSFFAADGAAVIASARAGNVIGGGDWARDRLVPDAIRAFSSGRILEIRNPHAVRPWQHVLDPLLGYLCLAERGVNEGATYADGWNFGPPKGNEVSVERVVQALAGLWGNGARWHQDTREHPHEAAYLKLDCSKAQGRLGWRPLIHFEEAVELTVDWYKAQIRGADLRAVSLAQIEMLLKRAVAVGPSGWQKTAADAAPAAAGAAGNRSTVK